MNNCIPHSARAREENTENDEVSRSCRQSGRRLAFRISSLSEDNSVTAHQKECNTKILDRHFQLGSPRTRLRSFSLFKNRLEMKEKAEKTDTV